MRIALAAALAALPLAGCVHNIPNTEIPDTPENRAIIEVVDQYRKAFDRRDVQGVMVLVSRSYFDDAGTSDKSDDVDYARLPQVLTETFGRVSQMRLELGVTSIATRGDEASVELFYDAIYKISTPGQAVAKRDADVQRMHLKREGQAWRISSGL